MTPTQRTLELLRKEGFTACVVEKWIPMRKIRKDAFGFGDVLAMHPGFEGYGGLWLLQVTSGDNHAARLTKATALPELKTWIISGGRFAVVSWSKRGARGKRKLWESRWQEVKLPDLGPAQLAS